MSKPRNSAEQVKAIITLAIPHTVKNFKKFFKNPLTNTYIRVII